MFTARVVPIILMETPLDTITPGGDIRTVYTLISIPICPYIYGHSGTNNIDRNPARHYHSGREYKEPFHIDIKTKKFLYFRPKR